MFDWNQHAFDVYDETNMRWIDIRIMSGLHINVDHQHYDNVEHGHCTNIYLMFYIEPTLPTLNHYKNYNIQLMFVIDTKKTLTLYIETTWM